MYILINIIHDFQKFNNNSLSHQIKKEENKKIGRGKQG